MGSRLRQSIIAIGIAAVLATLWGVTESPVIGQGRAYQASRTAAGQPDLNGFWQALNTANWDIEEHGAQPAPHHNLVGAYLAQPAGFNVVEGGAIPYKPEALARRKQHFEKRLDHDPIRTDNVSADLSDPEAKCFQIGGPRMTYLPYPFQILQTQNAVLMAYEYAGASRVIHLDRNFQALLPVAGPMGQSVGRWEGETLVVETMWFANAPWLDRAGNFISENARVVERYTATSPDHLMYEATINDPDVFTRPWKITMPLYRRLDPNMQLLEFQCIPFVEEYMYGRLKKQTAR